VTFPYVVRHRDLYAAIDANRSGTRPASARHLASLVGHWAIGDDYDREVAVDRATDNELSELVEAVAAAGDDFWEWFAGSASFTSRSSPEYIRDDGNLARR
jgi:hypothetical protein